MRRRTAVPDAGARPKTLSRSVLGMRGVLFRKAGAVPRRVLSMRPRSLRAAMAACLVTLLVVALIPMVLISAYDHSYADDWHYGVDAYHALQTSGGLFAALKAAFAEVRDTFFSWQGTYSAIFLMALQPGVFSEAVYGWGAVGIIAAFIAATCYLTFVVLREVLGAPRSSWVACTCAVLLLQTQLLPSPVEGFWWYNSAIYYTFYHALMLVMTGLCIRIARARTYRRALGMRGIAVRGVILAVLAFVVAGGNFVTGVVCGLMLVVAVVLSARTAPRRAAVLACALLVFIAGFTVSLAAPGNAARQATQFPDDALGVIPTLLHSGFAGFEYCALWFNGLLVLALAACLPFMAGIARRSSCSFARPWIAPLVSLAVFMASFTPTFFSMGTPGPGRVQNIRYDLFVLLVFGCAMWAVGWAQRRLERAGVRFVAPMRMRVSYAAALLALTCGVLSSFALDGRHVQDLVSLSAAHSLLSGEAADYDEQVRERLDVLATSKDQTVYLPFYTAGPKVLFMGDIRDNMDNYINFRLAQWYGKKEVLGYSGSLG